MAWSFVLLAVGMIMSAVSALPLDGPIYGTGFSDVLRKIPVGPVGATYQPGMVTCPFQSVAFEADVIFQGVSNANNWIVDYGPGWDRGFSVGSDGQYLRCSVYGFTIKEETPQSMIYNGVTSKVGMYWDGQTLTCLLNGVVTGTVSTLPSAAIPCNIQNPFIQSANPPQAQLWIGGEGCTAGSDYCDSSDGRWFWNGVMDNITLNGITLMTTHTTTVNPVASTTTTFNWNLTTTPSFPSAPLPVVATANATTTSAPLTTLAPVATENATVPATPVAPVVTENATTNVSRLYEEDTLADASEVGPSRMSAFAVAAGVSSLFVAFAMVAMRFVRPRRNIYEDSAQLIEADDELSLRGAPVHQEAVE